MFLTLPISWRGTVAQYAGRLRRLHDGKREVRIYDYADLNVPILARMFDRRCHGYPLRPRRVRAAKLGQLLNEWIHRSVGFDYLSRVSRAFISSCIVERVCRTEKPDELA